MFYSQFILAKKGPLGTIWIAAHLERKLRKNQVADTDIGVSVDSILSPDVPIALRLSSHLLLGVVRIYNRKVNYLFDDCSEALLKVKQAFRSAAVDLPPEESKAPYHSITLPETFDLDDFELPDNDIFHGSFVDHHISSKEQITLQDTLDGVTYSTSKFGLDERFGDGDASGLDLDEELFLDKVDVAGLTNERSDPWSSVGPMTPVKHNKHPEIRTGNSGTRGVEDDADLMEYAQAPGTPGLVEEPNISNVKEVSACDDHMELENPFGESTLIENAKDNLYGDKQEADLSPQNSKSCDAVPTVEECGHRSGSLDVDSSKLQRKTHVEANSEHVQIEVVSGSRPPSDPVGQDKSVNSSLELADKIIGASRVPYADDVKSGAADGMNSTLPVDESEYHQGLFDTSLENDAREISPNCHQDESFPQNRETQVSNEMGDPSSSKLDVHEKVASSENLFIRPCNSRMEQPDFISECDMSANADVQSDVTDLATSGRVEMVMIGKACSRAGNPEEVSKENHIQEHELQEGIGAASDEPNCQVKNASAHYDSLVDNLYSSAEANLSAPEKLLSVPEDVVDQQNMFGEISPGELVGLDASDAGSKVISSKKRSFTENTMTEQSLNAVESSRLVRFKRTIESVPDDDDLLSSILVGRSSVLKVQSTPRPSEAASTERTRSARRTPKRKVLTDDPMVLHGDMIREQLTNSEDIRRVRKKAPCLQSEISLIEKRYLEEETFLEPLFSGLSIELVSLHSRIWNLRGIQVCNDDPKDSSLENLADLRLPSENEPPENDQVASPQTTAAPVSSPVRANNDDSLTTATEPPSTSLNAKNCETLNVDSDKDSEKHNVAEQSGVTITDVLSSDRDGEMAKTCESPLPTDNGNNEVHVMNIEIDACDEQSKLNGDVEADVSNSGPLLGASGPETSNKNDDEEKNAHPVELNSAKIDAEDKLATEDELISRDGEVYSGFETESLVRDDDVLFEVAQETATVEKLSNSKQEELEIDKQNEMHSALFGENVEYSSYAAAQDYGRSPEHPEAHHHYAMGAANSVYDMHDQEELKYSAAGNDTDFLNVDDDELNEMPDDHDVHDDEEARFIENTGWSSRTRAVSKYLQTLFIKEAEQGRKSLSLENLLVGKSRKEASRMFFEILVLKTRDYIHVEQRNPFDEIAMKPQTRLMKSHF